MADQDSDGGEELSYIPSAAELKVQTTVLRDYLSSRSVMQKSYNQFNNRTLIQAVDDWTQRFNGYVPPQGELLESWQTRIFLNFTRNQVTSYLSKVAMNRPKAKIKATNKKSGNTNQRLADALEDLNRYSLDAENGDARLLEICLESTVKGTAIIREGYRKQTEKAQVPKEYNAETGIVTGQEVERIIYDNCYQSLVPIEDFCILNAYQPDIQKQPAIIERQTTTSFEAEQEFGKRKNWKYVVAGRYTNMTTEATTFYRNQLVTDLKPNEVEILRYYNKKKKLHVIMINGIVIYHGIFPYKDGLYPYARYIFEPFETDFFWGMGFPQKIMGEQDLQNTFINMMADKQYAALLPFGLTSDVDDMIDDDILAPNKFRKVGDINKWRIEKMPGIDNADQSMLQTVINLARENSGDIGGVGGSSTPKGGKVTARQLLLKQQESMQRIGFSMNFLEDGERDRTILRVNHIMQFFSIPKIEKITGENGEMMNKLIYRDIRIDDTKLDGPGSSGKMGTRVVRLVDNSTMNPDDRENMSNELSVIESMGELNGEPTEALAVPINMFGDYNFGIQVVKNSTYEQNRAVEQAVRQEYATWRLNLAQSGAYQVNAEALVRWVDETYSIDTDQFEAKQPAGEPAQSPQPGQPEQIKQPQEAMV